MNSIDLDCSEWRLLVKELFIILKENVDCSEWRLLFINCDKWIAVNLEQGAIRGSHLSNTTVSNTAVSKTTCLKVLGDTTCLTLLCLTRLV